MPKFAGRAIALFVVLLIAAGSSASAATNDFYLNLLRRGIANFDAGQFDAAVRELDVAAFGLIESIDHFETAKVYAAIANDRLGRVPQARAAAQRILAAERVQRRFAQVTLPAEVRTAFMVVARKVLSTAEVAALSRENAPVPPAVTGQPRVVQQPTPSTTRTQTPVPPPAPAPQVATQQPPVTAPSPVVPAPQNSSATTAEQPRAAVPEPKPAEPKLPEPKPVVPAPQTTTPPRETPRKIEETVIAFPSEPAPVKPQPKPEVARVEPPKVEPPKVDRPKVEPAKADPPKPAPAPARPTTQPVPRDIPGRLAAAERFLAQNNLIESRAIYRELLDVPTLDHATILAVGEGLYRARDFAGAVRAFERAGALRNGEEPYRYYLAVALYETGNYAKAKRELAAALPHIEITPSVTRYQAKIEGAID